MKRSRTFLGVSALLIIIVIAAVFIIIKRSDPDRLRDIPKELNPDLYGRSYQVCNYTGINDQIIVEQDVVGDEGETVYRYYSFDGRLLDDTYQCGVFDFYEDCEERGYTDIKINNCQYTTKEFALRFIIWHQLRRLFR